MTLIVESVTGVPDTCFFDIPKGKQEGEKQRPAQEKAAAKNREEITDPEKRLSEKIPVKIFAKRDKMAAEWRRKGKKEFSGEDWQVFNSALERSLAKSH